jgi:hypothetical protein
MALVPAREAAFAALAARLSALLTGTTVERNRDAPAAPENCPLLVLHDGDHSVETESFGLVTYRMTAQLAGYLAGDTLAAVMTAASTLHAQAIGALRCNSISGGTPAPIVVGDQEIEVEEISMRVDPATVADSDAPLATFLCDIAFNLRLPEGAPFLDI